MKKLYALHILSLIILLLIGYNFVTELTYILEIPQEEDNVMTSWQEMSHQIRSRFLTRIYGVCSLFTFAFSAFVAWKTITKLKKTGNVLLLGSILGFIGTTSMINSPSSVNLEQVFLAWIIYVIIGIGLSLYGFVNYKEPPNERTYYADEILDDEMGQ